MVGANNAGKSSILRAYEVTMNTGSKAGCLTIDDFPKEYDDVHIIRARGKGIIPSVVKILNQFTANYGVLHDADTKMTSTGTGNPVWTINTKILTEVKKSTDMSKTVLIACKTNFEVALLDVIVNKDKPYYTLEKMKTDTSFKEKVKRLLDAL